MHNSKNVCTRRRLDHSDRQIKCCEGNSDKNKNNPFSVKCSYMMAASGDHLTPSPLASALYAGTSNFAASWLVILSYWLYMKLNTYVDTFNLILNSQNIRACLTFRIKKERGYIIRLYLHFYSRKFLMMPIGGQVNHKYRNHIKCF